MAALAISMGETPHREDGGDGYLNLKTYRTISRILASAGLDHSVETMKKHYKIVVSTPMGDRSFLLGHGPNPKKTTERSAYRQIDKLIAEVREWREAHAVVAEPIAQAEIALASPEVQAEPVLQVRDGAVRADSRNIAAVFGRRHADVLRAIRDLDCSHEFAQRNFASFKIKDLTGESTSHVEMSRDGFAFLVMGFTGANAARFKEAYIARFNGMEAALRGPAADPDLIVGQIKGAVLGYLDRAIAPRLRDMQEYERERWEAAYVRDERMLSGLQRIIDKATIRPGEPEMVTVHEIKDLVGVDRSRCHGGLTRCLLNSAIAWFSEHGLHRSSSRTGRRVHWFSREHVLDWWSATGKAIYERHLRAGRPQFLSFPPQAQPGEKP